MENENISGFDDHEQMDWDDYLEETKQIVLWIKELFKFNLMEVCHG